ncbi:MAG: hypothetical protein KGZ25_12525 [Planctomycetes bacterium]|nr:hypothetical protein [Planctomycetota bacterium]
MKASGKYPVNHADVLVRIDGVQNVARADAAEIPGLRKMFAAGGCKRIISCVKPDGAERHLWSARAIAPLLICQCHRFGTRSIFRPRTPNSGG